MRVLRRISSLVSTHAPQPIPADGTAVTAHADKKSIFTRALQGAVVLGAGLALTVGAAVAPQTAWAASQDGTYGASLATSGANEWQIVSGRYQGNEAANKTADTASDGQQYVRVQKNVVPTERENEFMIYLSIDKKIDMNEFFNGAILGVDNNMEGTVGDAGKINGQWHAFENSKAEYTWSEYYFSIDVYSDGKYIYTWNGVKYAPNLPGDFASVFMAPADADKNDPCLLLGQDLHGGQSPDDPFHFSVDVAWPAFDDVFGTVDNQAIGLGSVIDKINGQMSDIRIINCDGDASYAEGVITWNPSEKSPALEEDGWYCNIAELVYSAKLNVKDSCGLENGAPADAENSHVQTNLETTLDYSVTNVHIASSGSSTTTQDESASFTSPVVKGLLYDLKLKKVDSEDASKGLEDAEFTLTNSDGSIKRTATSGKDGNLEFSGLPHGTYTITETEAPDGYKAEQESRAVTLCYTSGVCSGTCCTDAIDEYVACTTDGHANNAVNENVIQIKNTRNEVQFQIPIYKLIQGREWQEGDSFEFEIEGLYGSPLPQCDGVEQTTVTVDYDDVVDHEDENVSAMLEQGVINSADEIRMSTTCPISFKVNGQVGNFWYKITEKGSNSSDLVKDERTLYVMLVIWSDGGGWVGDITEEPPYRGEDPTVSPNAIFSPYVLFVNRYVSLTFSGLQETKEVIGRDATEGEFTFSVQADNGEAAELAGLSGLADSLTGAKYDSTTRTLTFENGQSIDADSQTATTVRSANQLTLTAANVGKEYAYTYKELAVADSQWHQQQETVWRVTVTVDWDDPDTKDAIKATLTLEKSTDGGTTWQNEGRQTYSSAEDAQNPTDPLTVSFVNEYGSTLEIVKTDQDRKPLAGAEFTVTGTNNSYKEGPVKTALNEEGKAVARFENIPDGTYTITETVPTGYQKINDMTLEIDGDNATLTWADTNERVGEGAITKKNGIFTITIENYVNPNLPSTGSSGTVLMGGLGTAAIIVAGAWLLKQRGIDLRKFSSR